MGNEVSSLPSRRAVSLVVFFFPPNSPFFFWRIRHYASTSELTVRRGGSLTFASCADVNGGVNRYAINAVEECAGTDWRAVCRSTDEFDRIKHLIILPNYKETPETLRETLSVLASHPSAHSAYRVVLACEMGEQGVSEKVMTLIEEFSTAFFEICFTLHPRDIEGEAAGKSSNVAWASREMHRRNPTYLMQQIITV